MVSTPVNTEGAAASRPTGPVWDRLSMKTKRLIWVWSFLALPIVFYSVIRFYPTLQAFWLSLTDWDLMRPPVFIGLGNYERLFSDPQFWKVFRNTFTYLLIGTPISLLLAFTIAYYLDRSAQIQGPAIGFYTRPEPCAGASIANCSTSSRA